MARRGSREKRQTRHALAKGGTLRVRSARAVLLSESAFIFLQRVIHEQIPELVKYGFYEMGYRAGIDLSREGGNGQDPQETFRRSVAAYRAAGYGDIEVISCDLARPEIQLRGRNLFESSVARESGIYLSPRTVDHYSRGMFAGLASQLLGREVICEEMTCEFRGEDSCQFIVLPFGGEMEG